MASWSGVVARTDRHAQFVYDRDWSALPPRARALSLSLPITASRQIEGPSVENYFDNLLPDSEAIRRRLRDRFKTGSVTAFKLLRPFVVICVSRSTATARRGHAAVVLGTASNTPHCNSFDVARILATNGETGSRCQRRRGRRTLRLSIAGAGKDPRRCVWMDSGIAPLVQSHDPYSEAAAWPGRGPITSTSPTLAENEWAMRTTLGCIGNARCPCGNLLFRG